MRRDAIKAEVVRRVFAGLDAERLPSSQPSLTT
jgi:hypothetical protein